MRNTNQFLTNENKINQTFYKSKDQVTNTTNTSRGEKDLPYCSKNNLFFVTTPSNERKFYSNNLNTSPVKNYTEVNQAKPDLGNKTVIRGNYFMIDEKVEKDNLLINSLKKDSEFTFSQSEIQTTFKFTSYSNAKTQVKFLINEEEEVEEEKFKEIESKPSLNYVESRNKLIDFSKSKKFKEDENIIFSNNSYINNLVFASSTYEKQKSVENENQNTNFKTTEDILEETFSEQENSDVVDSKTKRLLALQSQLPVPINKKDDENFKILKMKEMKRVSLPNNKSAQAIDLEDNPPHQNNFNNVLNYSLCKKRKISHSVKKIYSSIMSLEDPKNKFIYKFPVYRDCEIGINEYWQAHIIESKADEDLPTDDEQLKLADIFNLNELQEAIEIFLEEGTKALRNRNLITLSNGKRF